MTLNFLGFLHLTGSDFRVFQVNKIVDERVHIRPAQFFLITPQTPQWSLGQNVPGTQFLANSKVVWPRLRGSEDFELAQN